MSINFTIKVNQLLTMTVDNLPDVVNQINYTIYATKENYSVDRTYLINVNEPTSENFTPFNQLTEQQVIAWIESLEEIDLIKNYLTEELERKIAEASLQIKTTPWTPVTQSVLPTPSVE